MFVAFAFLANDRLHNVIRKLALAVHRTHGAGLHAGLLPPHISLKQPFRVADLPAVEGFFDRFAAGIAPCDLTLTHLSGPDLPATAANRGVLWLEVQESPPLRALHDRLNAELARQFTGTEAPFDGAAYHFHATVALVQEPASYRQVLQDYRGHRVHITYRPEQIAMFYYDDDTFAPGTFMTYKVLPVTGARGTFHSNA